MIWCVWRCFFLSGSMFGWIWPILSYFFLNDSSWCVPIWLVRMSWGAGGVSHEHAGWLCVFENKTPGTMMNTSPPHVHCENIDEGYLNILIPSDSDGNSSNPAKMLMNAYSWFHDCIRSASKVRNEDGSIFKIIWISMDLPLNLSILTVGQIMEKSIPFDRTWPDRPTGLVHGQGQYQLQ